MKNSKSSIQYGALIIAKVICIKQSYKQVFHLI